MRARAAASNKAGPAAQCYGDLIFVLVCPPAGTSSAAQLPPRPPLVGHSGRFGRAYFEKNSGFDLFWIFTGLLVIWEFVLSDFIKL